MRHQPASQQSGFLLASIIMFGTLMTIMGFAIFDYANVARANLQNGLYRRIAFDAAESGIEFAYDRVNQNSAYTGTTAPTDCSNSNTALSPYLINDSFICSTFTVTEVSDGKFTSTGLIYRKINGGTQVIGTVSSKVTVTISGAIQNAAATATGSLTRVSRLDSTANNFGSDHYTPAATFSPTANSVLVATVAASQVCDQDVFGQNGDTITVSGGGLQWIPIAGKARDQNTLCDVGIRSFYAIVRSTPPTNVQVTVGTTYPWYQSLSVYVDEYQNADLTSPIAGSATGEQYSAPNSSYSLALNAAPNTRDIVVGTLAIGNQDGTNGLITPTGWTSAHASTPASGYQSQVFTNTNTTSSSVPFSVGTLNGGTSHNVVYMGYIVRGNPTIAGGGGGGGGGGSTGAPSAWQTATASPPTASEGQGHGVVYNGRNYITGGCGSSGAAMNNTRVGTLNNNGTIAGGIGTTVLPNAVCDSDAAVYNGRLYDVGGSSSTSSLAYATINADGTVGAYTTQVYSAFANLYMHTVQAYNGFLYVIGGSISYGSNVNQVSYAPINATTGAVGTFTNQTSFFGGSVGRCNASVIANGYMYIVGNDKIYVSQINANGSLGTPTISSIPAWRDCSNVVSNGSYIYVLGGINAATGGSSTNTVYYAPINATTGAVGTWVTSPNTLPAIRDAGVTFIYNGYIFYLNGEYQGGSAQQNAWSSLIQ